MAVPVQILGAPIAQIIREDAAAGVARLKERNIHPHLAFIYPAADGGAVSYAESQRRSCEKAGIGFSAFDLPAAAKQADLDALIDRVKSDPAVTGVILHSPWPKPLDDLAARLRLGADLDVEGLHPDALGRLVLGAPQLVPCTPAAAIEMLKASGVSWDGKHLVIVGRSPSVGRSLALLLLAERRAPTVTLCHSATADLAAVTRTADLLVVAAGKPGLIRAPMVKDGAVVVDVGTNAVPGPGGKTVMTGDVAFDEVAPKCAAITPVPGGVGPVTAALLLRNVVECCDLQFPE